MCLSLYSIAAARPETDQAFDPQTALLDYDIGAQIGLLLWLLDLAEHEPEVAIAA